MKNIFIIFIFIAIFIGCAKEDNSVPVIHLFQASPTSVEIGGQVTLTVLATDEEGDELSYIYQAGSGSIEGSGNTVKWKAPETPGKYSIKVNVSDGRHFSQSNVDITVIEKKVPREDTIIPGKQASGIMLGDKLSKAETLYGKGEQQVSEQYVIHIYNNAGVTIIVDSSNIIRGIFIFEPNKSKTAGGNGIGSTLVSIKKEFGEPEEIESVNNHWYWTKGIEISYDDSSRASMIFIFEPSNPAPIKRLLRPIPSN